MFFLKDISFLFSMIFSKKQNDELNHNQSIQPFYHTLSYPKLSISIQHYQNINQNIL